MPNTIQLPQAGAASAADEVLGNVNNRTSRMTIAVLKAAMAIAKADVGLSNADNTADLAKPVSTAQQAAIDAKVQNSLTASTTVAPSATAVAGALASKLDGTHAGAGGAAHADVVAGGASGFMTGTQATKLAGIEAGAQVNPSAAALVALIDTLLGTGWHAGAGAAWGAITGTLSSQTDLQAALSAKQALSTVLTFLATAASSDAAGVRTLIGFDAAARLATRELVDGAAVTGDITPVTTDGGQIRAVTGAAVVTLDSTLPSGWRASFVRTASANVSVAAGSGTPTILGATTTAALGDILAIVKVGTVFVVKVG